MSLEIQNPPKFQFDVITGDSRQRELENLLNHCFPVSPGTSFYDDFPVWNEKNGAAIFRVGTYDGGRLVSSASARIAYLKGSQNLLPVALIGGVVTDEAYRGYGLATQTVSLALQWIKQKNAALALLWGSEHSLYQRLGFELCGEQVRVPLSELAGVAIPPGMKVGMGWNPSLFRALQQRPEGLSIERFDEKWMSAHKNTKWFWTGDGVSVRAYAGVGRGIDLNGFVHEWGGEKEQLLPLLAAIGKSAPDLQLLGSPILMRRYGISFDPAQIEFLSMVKVLDAKATFSAFSAGAVPDLSGFSEAELPQMLFGPLPLWVWGLDAS